jgi:hypothetical protein
MSSVAKGMEHLRGTVLKTSVDGFFRTGAGRVDAID